MSEPNRVAPVWYIRLYRKFAYDRTWWFIHTHDVATKQETEGAYSPDVVSTGLRHVVKKLDEEVS